MSSSQAQPMRPGKVSCIEGVGRGASGVNSMQSAREIFRNHARTSFGGLDTSSTEGESPQSFGTEV